MGTVGLVRVKAAGESKEFHLVSKDATDSRLNSGPSYFVEVDVRDNVSQRINVMFICNEWGSSKGGLSTFNREFAVNLAKASGDQIKVHCYVCSSSEEDRVDAGKQGVNLITAQRLPGSNDPMDWLKMPPPELPAPDVVVGHGRKFGSAALFISDRTKCKWIHFVHVFCEDLGKHKLEGDSTSDAIADNEEKNKRELELCKAADLVVTVGSRLQRKYRRSLPDIKVEVITPGIFENLLTRATPLANVQPAEAEEFSIFMIGRGSFEDFALKGYDIIGKAVDSLGRKFELTFVGSPRDEQRRIEEWFLKETNIARNQLTIRGYCTNEEMKKMFREADLIVMPSRTEGFGLVALEAISAGVPVLVSSESGIAKALEEVAGGRTVVVKSDKPEDWAKEIQQLSEQKPKERRASAMHLRDKYGEIYTWTKECERFEQMIHGLIQRACRDVPLNCELTDQTGNITVKVETVTSGQDKGLVQTNRETNPLSDANEDTASLTMSSECTEADSGREGDSVTGPRDANGDTASRTFSKSKEADSDREGDSATGPTGKTSVDKDEKILNSLHYTARVGTVAEIESLLSLGFSIDSRDDKEKTPLMMAAANGNLHTVEYLLEKGADPSLEDKYGWNLLHCASEGDNPDIIELMLGHVSSIDSINNRGQTPLMIAVTNDKLQAVKYLIEKGADPSLKSNNGWNSLHHASRGGNPFVIELMLGRVPSIDSINNRGQTSLMIAARNDKLQAVEYLLEQGADPSLQDNNGWSLLHHASQGGNFVIIELMLSHVPNIDSITYKGATSLMIAVGNDKLQVVKYLLGKGADPSLKDDDGWNWLHWASRVGNVAIIEKILSYGVDIESRTNSGSTPLLIAKKCVQSEAVTYLLSRGAKS